MFVTSITWSNIGFRNRQAPDPDVRLKEDATGCLALRSVAVTATDHTPNPLHETVSVVYLSDSRRVLATLIRLLGDFDVAEEPTHDAFSAATEQWPREGVPANPRAWLVSTGRFKAIDGLRRRARFDALDDVRDKAEAAG